MIIESGLTRWKLASQTRLPCPSIAVRLPSCHHALPTLTELSTSVYGTGKETERAYFYQQGGYERDEVTIPGTAACDTSDCSNQTMRTPLDLPLSRRSWIDSSVNLADTAEPKVRSGV